MSLFNTLAGAVAANLGNRNGVATAALVPAVIDMLGKYPGGVAGLLQQLQQGGLGAVVAAWLAGGTEPAAPAALERALEPGLIEGLAQRSGQDRATVLQGLGSLLPRLVSLAVPNGDLSDARLPDAGQLLGALGGLLNQRA